MSDWHGWSRRDSDHGALHIGAMPGRKSIALYQHKGCVLDVLAYFRDEDAARRALAWLDDFAGPRVQISVVHDLTAEPREDTRDA